MSNTPLVSFSLLESDIGVLTFDDPQKAVNILSQAMLRELAEQLDRAAEHGSLVGLILRSGKPGSFIAGADLREFAASLDRPSEEISEVCRHGRQLFQRLSQLPFVTVAAIDGVCLGGGAEMAAWCDRRVLSSDGKTQFGFPEVKLGLLPGWGGTARLPRIIGLGNAVQMITSGEPVDARTAASYGLADDVAPADQLTDAAVRLIRDEQKQQQYVRDRERRGGPIAMNETELAFLGATASGYIQQQTKGQYPAPLAALETILEGSQLDVDAACDLEAAAMAGLFGSPINRALINVFFLTDRNKKDRGTGDPASVRPAKSVAVIGAGIMGAGIAAASLKRGLSVTLADERPEALDRGLKQVLEEVAYNKQTKQADPARAIEFAAQLKRASQDAEIVGADLIVEAIIENEDAKQALFTRLEPQVAPETILASNTSTIPITKLASQLAHPERFVGIHFFNPVRKMPLVEVIRGEKTSDATVASAVAYAKSIGKSPIVVNDGPGFLVNRLLLPYLNEALELLREGVSMEAIDRAAKAFGMPLGPIALYDMVGLDTAAYAGRVMWQAFPDRIIASPILTVLLKAGRLGQKSGAGFYSYAKDKQRGQHDPTVAKILEPLVRDSNDMDAEQITLRLILPMVLEATRAIEEKLVRSVRDLDLGMIFGLGFPPFRGGLLFWADTLGPKKLLELLRPFEPLGERMRPTPLLEQMAASGKKFYDLE